MEGEKIFISVAIPYNQTYFNLNIPNNNPKYIQILSAGIHSTVNNLCYIELSGLTNYNQLLYLHSAQNSSFLNTFEGLIYSCPKILSQQININIKQIDNSVIGNGQTVIYFLFHY